MPVPSAITDLSTTPASNSPAGSESPATTDDYFRSHAAFIAQLRAVIGGGTDPNIPVGLASDLDVITQAKNSGTTGGTSTAYTLTPAKAITSYSAGMTFWVRFHVASGASPTLMISGLASPPALVRQNSSGGFVAIAAGEIPLNHASRVTLLSATQALVEDMPPAAAAADLLNSTRIDVASAATVDLTAEAPNTRHINITGSNTIKAFTVAIGQAYFVRFAGALTLTNNANIVTQSGADILTEAGDTCIIRATAANVVEVIAPPAALRSTQAYTDVTAGRAFDTLYTNSKSTWRFVCVTPVAAGSKTYSIEIGGNTFGGLSYGSATIKSPMFFAVPPWKTYRITTTGTPTLERWQEA